MAIYVNWLEPHIWILYLPIQIFFVVLNDQLLKGAASIFHCGLHFYLNDFQTLCCGIGIGLLEFAYRVHMRSQGLERTALWFLLTLFWICIAFHPIKIQQVSRIAFKTLYFSQLFFERTPESFWQIKIQKWSCNNTFCLANRY